MTQTLPFITRGIPTARSQNPSQCQHVLQKNGHRNQHKCFLLKKNYPFCDHQCCCLKTEEKKLEKCQPE